MQPLFELGHVVCTQAALAFLQTHNIDAGDLILRHRRGDWGDLCSEDKLSNDQALDYGGRLMSSYNIAQGRVWLITEHDRSVTTILLPEDY